MFLRESGSLSYLAPVSCVAFPKRGKHDASWYVICCEKKELFHHLFNSDSGQHFPLFAVTAFNGFFAIDQHAR